MKIGRLFSENIKIALVSIRTNLLRTILTVLIIAFGITALVGILTAVESIKNSISSEFSNMGANTFTLVKMRRHVKGGGGNRRKQDIKNISFNDAMQFKEAFNFPAKVSVNCEATGVATCKYKSEKTNPNIEVTGVDENYLAVSNYELARGRNFTQQEAQSNVPFVIIGSAIASELFTGNENPVGKKIQVGNATYSVLGVLKSQGTSFGGTGDKFCLIPISNMRKTFAGYYDYSYRITIMPLDPDDLELAKNEAEGIFRRIRRLTLYDENDFRIRSADRVSNMMLENISVVTIGATIIGLITLIGAGIGLMNIMLVSVAERTREIGVRKALGAKASTIKQQFLFESVFIGQLGGVLGIVFGILAGNGVALITGGGFIVPWGWVISGVLLCFVVGVVSGYFPAVKASRLDAIEALRYE
ncbi:MAG: ABC transporter permease [Bacteroidota bacterium]|nr:ABC transporter permease [Bacteroidota bacterium]